VHAQPEQGASCPVCDASGAEAFLHRPSVPVHQNLLYDTPDAARAVARGELDLRACAACRFIFNAAYDPRLLSYGPGYENSQDASPAFSAHLQALVRRVASSPECRNGRVVEVGCGKGTFLRRLLAEPGVRAEAIGFDPAYVGPTTELDGRLGFERELYSRENAVDADVVVCRHVVEHVPDPVELLRTASATRLFVETPSLEWILEHRVPWDFFYEHCSLFTAAALTVAIERAGYRAVSVQPVFGGQYLWAEASHGAAQPVAAQAQPFDELVAGYDGPLVTARVSALVRQLAADGPTMIWGAGAKGATLCDLIDPDASLLAGVVDLNPAKHGRYVAGTGHPIVSAEEAVERGIATAVVLNPNYTAEVSSLLTALGSGATTLDLTLEAARCD
jgi:hypothetical protein